MAFCSFFQIFECRSSNHFLGKRDNASKTFYIKSNLYLEKAFQLLFDSSRQLFLEFSNIPNVLNVSI